MRTTSRWLVALGATVAAFVTASWLSGALILPLWLKSDADRWVVAASLGVAVAALAALWGARYAKADETGCHEDADQARHGVVMMDAEARDSSRIYQAGRDQTINDR